MSPATMANEPVDKRKRALSEVKFPVYNLDDSIKVAEVIHKSCGGSSRRDVLAGYLKYSGTNNGSFLNRQAAAKLFGLIENRGDELVPTDLAYQIMSPVYPEQRQEALVTAFYNVPLFNAVYQACKGKELPSDLGMKNLLLRQFGVIASRLSVAQRVLMESAESAGFFQVRGRSHLIEPPIKRGTTGRADIDVAPEDIGGGGGGYDGSGGDNGDGGGPLTDRVTLPPSASVYGQASLQYATTLMEMMREGKPLDPAYTELIGKVLEGMKQAEEGPKTA